jgi:GTPase SAR1 family protein
MTSTVPYQTVKTFTDRATIYTQLVKGLEEQASHQSSPRSLALWGRGGSGKSQLALRYCERHQTEYDPILWIDAHSPNSARQSFSVAS